MPDMYGAPTGIIAGQDYLIKQQLAPLAYANENVKLQSAQLVLAQQKKMMDLMSQPGAFGGGQGGTGQGGQPGAYDVADAMDSLTRMAFLSGDAQSAADYASKASTIRNQQSLISNRSNATKLKSLSLYSNLLDGVHDEMSWQQANAMYEMETGQKSEFSQLPYRPEIVDRLKQQSVSAKDKAQIGAARARTAASYAEVKEREIRGPLLKAQTEEAQARTDKIRKAAGKDAGVPSRDVSEVSKLIQSEFPGTDPAEARVKSWEVAERAQELYTNQHLTRSQAYHKAFNEYKARGEFAGMKQASNMSGSLAKPMDMPSDKGAMQPNKAYKMGGKFAGQVGVWNGKDFDLMDKEDSSGDKDQDDQDDEEENDN